MSTTRSISIYTIGKILLFGLALYFPVFHYLGHHPLHLWDESLFGLRALHMLTTGEYMYNFNQFDGMFDHANTKLPFTTWIQVLSMKLIGVNELALRIPISLIFLATVFFLIRYTYKHFGSYMIGVIAVLIMVCSPGIVRNHMLRSGEHDMPLLCYMLVAVVTYFQYLYQRERRYLVVFTVAMIAAFLTKNLLAGVVIPGMLIYTIYAGKLKQILTDKFIWVSIAVILLSYVATVVYLQSQNEGFITRMWNYELMGRYTEAKDGHQGGFWFFIKDLAFTHFRIYFWMVPLAIFLLWDSKLGEDKKRLIRYLGIVYFAYLFIITFAKTKLFWYGMPAVPIAALLLGIAIHHIYTAYVKNWSSMIKYTTVVLFLLGAFILPYGLMIKDILQTEKLFGEEKYGVFIDRLAIDQPTIRTFTIGDSPSAFESTFWREKYNMMDKGYNISSTRNSEFAVGDTVVTCINKVYEYSYKNYDLEMIQMWEGCYIYVLKNKK